MCLYRAGGTAQREQNNEMTTTCHAFPLLRVHINPLCDQESNYSTDLCVRPDTKPTSASI